MRHFKIFDEKKLLLGFTATPLRGDGKCLSNIYQSHSFKMTLQEATQNGYICPVHGARVYLEKSLADIESTAGDYKISDLENVMNCDSVNHIVSERCQHLSKTPALVFCTSVDHATRISNLLVEKGRKAAVVSYKTSKEELSLIFAKLKNGELEFITNAVKLSEGFDYPPIQSIISVRPTRSPVLYKQMIGRGLRNSGGKHECFVLEFCGNDPKMLCWDDIDNNCTFQSFTDAQKKSRIEAINFYRNRFGNPNLTVLDVRISPFEFYECYLRRFCKYTKFYRYIPGQNGFIIGELRPSPYGSYGNAGHLMYCYICFWKEEFRSFYVWDGGGLLGNNPQGVKDKKSEQETVGYTIPALEKFLIFFVSKQPSTWGKWYPSEEEPATHKQMALLPAVKGMSARKAEMCIEDHAIKKAIQMFWINQKMPYIEGGESHRATKDTIIYKIYH